MGQVKEVKYYTDEEKRAIIEEYLISGQSAKSIQKKYGLYGHSKISDWMNKFGMRVKSPSLEAVLNPEIAWQVD